MSKSMPSEKTPLTEQQARSLALWWDGDYQKISPTGGESAVRHGVVITGKRGCCAQVYADGPIMVFSLEEARDMENRRGFQEAASPDWIG